MDLSKTLQMELLGGNPELFLRAKTLSNQLLSYPRLTRFQVEAPAPFSQTSLSKSYGWNAGINEQLGQRNLTTEGKVFLEHFLSALAKATPIKEMILFRGIKEHPQYTTGDLWFDAGIVSKSSNANHSRLFADGGSLFICHYPQSSQHLSLGTAQHEIISYPGEYFQIKMCAREGGLLIYWAEFHHSNHTLPPPQLLLDFDFANSIVGVRGFKKDKLTAEVYIGCDVEIDGLISRVADGEQFLVEYTKFESPEMFLWTQPVQESYSYRRKDGVEMTQVSIMAYLRDLLLDRIDF